MVSNVKLLSYTQPLLTILVVDQCYWLVGFTFLSIFGNAKCSQNSRVQSLTSPNESSKIIFCSVPERCLIILGPDSSTRFYSKCSSFVRLHMRCRSLSPLFHSGEAISVRPPCHFTSPSTGTARPNRVLCFIQWANPIAALRLP